MARSKRTIGLGVAAALVVAALTGVAIVAVASNDTHVNRPPVTPPTTIGFEEDEWSIATPAGWTSEEITSKADAAKAVRYSGPNGEYFIVAIDPLGSDFTLDTRWTYAPKGDGFKIVAKSDCTGGVEQGCSSNDGRFDGYLMWETGTEPKKLGGHVWYFMFGNAKSPTIDAKVFEEIVASIRVN